MTALVDRPDLVETVLNAPGPVVIVEGPAGMGKTALLALIAVRLDLPVVSTLAPPPAGSAVTLWDLPAQGDAGPLPERLFAPGNRQRLILARRPGRAVPGLARAIAYGQASRIGPEALMVGQTELTALFGPDAPDLADVGGGWPLIVFRPAVLTLDEAALADFLAADLIDALGEGDLVALALLLAGAGGAGETGRAEGAETLARLLPLVRPGSGGRLEPALARLAGPMERALDQVIARRVGEAGRAKALAEHFAARGRPVEAIGIFQRAGFFDLALKLFESAGGFFLLYFCGPAAFDRVLSGFPRTLAMQSEALVLAHALQAMKSGDIARARRLLVDRFGPAAHDLGQLFSPRSIFSREFRAFRLLMLLYEDHFLAEEEIAQAFALASEFRQDDHLFRGSFYNSMLEFYIRNRQFAEAEDVAQRAMAHYQAAGSAHLAFYISLHQALIRLMMGDALAARKQAVRGAAHLDAMGFDSPNDRRLQQLLEACIDYESGRAEPLARFLSLEIDDFSHGEIWPSLLDLALHYGSQALGEHFSVLAARSFLERWRVYQASNGQFQTMIAVREAAVLQNANRWQEAAGVLSAIASPVDRALVLSTGSALTGLKDRDELALALAWLRQTVYEQPQREGLDALLGAMTANLALTERQRMAVEIWGAYVAKRQRDLTRTRALLQKTFGDCARLGTIAPLSEERVFLQDLIDNQRITGFLTTTLANRQILRRLRDAGRLAGDSADARSLLSRREAKILLMISEGAANKFVANTLGLSEATVKFHLGNIYRKLGCRGRQQAIASARALGLIG